MPTGTDTHTGSLMTLAELARHFSLPESTARYYCKRFAAFIPSVGEGRKRRFTDGAAEVLQVIIDTMNHSRTASAAEAELERRFPRTIDAAPAPAQQEAPAAQCPAVAVEQTPAQFFPDAALMLLQQQSDAMQRVASVLEHLEAREQRMAEMEEEARQQKEENARLRKQLADMRILLETSERTQQADMDQLRIWISRLIRRQRQ